MSASVSDDMIRSYFERWQRLEEEKRAISDDLKELFAEAKGNGLDSKALRTVFREQVGDKAAMQEFDATCDLYRASLNASRARPARSAREEQPETADKIGDRDQTHNSHHVGRALGADRQGAMAAQVPDTQSDGGAIVAVKAQSRLANADSVEPSPSDTNPQPSTLSGADKPEAVRPPPVSGALSDDDVPAFLKRDHAPKPAGDKPNCLKLKDGHCRIGFATSALCAECNAARSKARAGA